MRHLAGEAVIGLDPAGEWRDAVRQAGGTYLEFGPDAKNGAGWNPFRVDLAKLYSLSSLESWLAETAEFLEALLELNRLEHQNLKQVLVECVAEAVGEGFPLDAGALQDKAEDCGYWHLAGRLAEMRPEGAYGWLFIVPVAQVQLERNSFIFGGFSPPALACLNDETRQLCLAHFLQTLLQQRTSANQNYGMLVILDEAQAWLAQPSTTSLLQGLAQSSQALKIKRWLLSPRCDEWLVSACGQRMVEEASNHYFFNQNGAGLLGMARRLNIAQRAVKVIQEQAPGTALVRDRTGALSQVLPLPGEYVARLIATTRPLVAEAKVTKAAIESQPVTVAPTTHKAAKTAASSNLGLVTASLPKPLEINFPAISDKPRSNSEAQSQEATEPDFIFKKAKGA